MTLANMCCRPVEKSTSDRAMPQSSAKETAEVAMSRLDWDLVTAKSTADATENDDTQCNCVTVNEFDGDHQRGTSATWLSEMMDQAKAQQN